MKKILLSISFVMLGFVFTQPLAIADNEPAPVEDLSSGQVQMQDQQMQSQQPQGQQNMGQQNQTQDYNQEPSSATNNERLGRLEQQMRNFTDMNMPQQIEELRQEVQQLNGQIQVQNNSIRKFENQQRTYYQDSNSRTQSTDAGRQALPSQSNTSNVAAPMARKSLDDSGSYRAAFNMLLKKQYDDALGAFQNYISQYPRGTYAANAYYWMGELYLKRNDTEMAEKSFTKIINTYSNSNKVPDAKLKLAMLHMKQGKRLQARQELRAIKHQFPNSTAAQLASIQLQRLEP